MRAFFLLVSLFLTGSTGLSAQGSILFEAEGPSREVADGSSFEVVFSLKNATAQRFVPPDFKGFRIVGGPSETRSAGFVNGKSYQQQSWAYQLEAGDPGTYTIGIAVAQTGSQTLRTQPLVVRVGKAKKAGKPQKSAPGTDDRLFVSTELDRETAWVGQQVICQIKLYTQVNVSEYDILELPQPEGVFAQERRRFDTRVEYQTVQRKKYAVRTLYEMALFPQQSGVIAIGPAHVRLGVEPSGGGLRALLGSVPMLLQTPPVSLHVKPLPEPAPANFSGGVGTYSWTVVADKTTLSTDDALTLTVSIEGNGDPRRFANPRFSLPDGLEVFEPKALEQEEYETGEQYVHACKLEYVVLPKEPGAYTLSPELIVFDPDSNQYRTLRTEQPVPLSITRGPNYGKNQAPLDTIQTTMAEPNRLDIFWQQAIRWFPTLAFGGLVAGLITTATVFFFRRMKKKAAAPQVQQQPKTNQRQLRSRLQELERQSRQGQDPKAFYHELLRAVQHRAATKLGCEPAELTEQVMLKKLAERGVPQPVSEALARVWQACETSVFSGQASIEAMRPTWEMADAAMRELDAALPG
ncbi:MAG: BatD family protein [Saprospiraceae bacterium]